MISISSNDETEIILCCKLFKLDKITVNHIAERNFFSFVITIVKNSTRRYDIIILQITNRYFYCFIFFHLYTPFSALTKIVICGFIIQIQCFYNVFQFLTGRLRFKRCFCEAQYATTNRAIANNNYLLRS